MIRKLAIVTLTLMSIAVLAAWVVGYTNTKYSTVRDIGTNLKLLRSGSGRAVLIDLSDDRQIGFSSLKGELGAYLLNPVAADATPTNRTVDLRLVSFEQTVLKPFPICATLLSDEERQLNKFINSRTEIRHRIAMQSWLLLTLTASYPLFTLVRFARRKRRGPNDCAHCGYDLTGNESGRCSECGAEVEKS